MTDSNGIVSGKAAPDSFVVGFTTSYLITISASTPLVSGDIISLTFPSEMNSPLANTLSKCRGVSSIDTTLSCKSNGLYGVLLYPKFSGGTIAVSKTFAFSVANV